MAAAQLHIEILFNNNKEHTMDTNNNRTKSQIYPANKEARNDMTTFSVIQVRFLELVKLQV